MNSQVSKQESSMRRGHHLTVKTLIYFTAVKKGGQLSPTVAGERGV
jgi:hypothetical protein